MLSEEDCQKYLEMCNQIHKHLDKKRYSLYATWGRIKIIDIANNVYTRTVTPEEIETMQKFYFTYVI